MKKNVLFLLLLVTFPSHAEIYKCLLPSEQILYQSTPCPSTAISQNVVKVTDVDPRVLAEAQVKFKAFEAQLAAQEQLEARAAMERQKVLREQQIVNALQRAAWAEEQRVLLARQQAMYPGWGDIELIEYWVRVICNNPIITLINTLPITLHYT